MDDRELLELAAKAAGVKYAKGDYLAGLNAENGWWNPLNDDADEARLENALSLEVKWSPRGVLVGNCYEAFIEHADKHAARRYAGTRAAAEIGRVMK